jgi:hypothetical protein
MPSERAASLADALAAVNAESITFAESCTDTQWHTVVPGEGWPVGVVLHHIAEGHANGLKWLEAMASGMPVTDSGPDIDEWNVEHAARCADVGVVETVALLTQNGARVEAAIRRLTDDELDQTAPFGPAGGRALPAEQMAAVTAQHARGHLDHAREAVASDPA